MKKMKKMDDSRVELKFKKIDLKFHFNYCNIK